MTEWRMTDEELKKIMARHDDADNEEESVRGTIAELVPHLKTNPCYANLPKAIIKQFEQAKTFHSFNRAMDLLYDYADDSRIWLGFISF